MSITKVNGTIETQIGEHGRIKVVSFKKDGLYINSPVEIKKEFPPEGFIFAPHFFAHFNFKPNALIEFPFTDFKSSKKDGDLFLLDYKVECKTSGFPVYNLSENILLSEYSINQSILNNYSEKFDSQHFYIQCKESVYGPFKNQNTEILPKTNKEVCRFDLSELTIYYSGECSYLLNAPIRNNDLIDCMTSAQLNIWLKDQIKNLKLDIDFIALAKALETLQLVGLDIDRMKRVLTGIDQISLTHSELKFLASSSEKLEILYDRLLKKAEIEIKEELLTPTIAIKNQIELTISELSNNKEKVQKELDLYSSKLDELKNEHEYIINNKNRLIEDIKFHAEIGISKPLPIKKFMTYYEQVFELKRSSYNDIHEFITIFYESLDDNEDEGKRFGHNSILQLKDKKYFLSNNIEAILQIAKFSNNCKILIQQVEADWIKFEYLFENGLKQIWSSAHENPHLIHFFVLEDINMASIECYGKPLLDLIDGIRMKLPGLDTAHPNNLWIFGIPLSENSGFDFGLPLIKQTYKNWGFFPKQETALSFNTKTPEKYLSMEKIFDHNSIVPSLVSEYFSL